MPAARRYSFGSCIVEPARREVRLAGAVHPLAPRVFDLLVYLLERRDRVVTKDELLDVVWRGAFLSGSAVANAVMKARQAIGDRADEPRLIRTVHRVGYRFVGEVVEGDGLGTQAVAEGPLRIAVLPFDDRTGERGRGWVALGLQALLNQALECDPRLHVASVETVLGAMQSDAAGAAATWDAQARTLAPHIGARWICGVAVGLAVDGWTFDYELIAVDGPGHRGRLVGPEPIELCLPLARRLQAHWGCGAVDAQAAGGGASPASLGAIASSEAFARAMHARAMNAPEEALAQVDRVLALAPGHRAMSRLRFELLCELARPEASAVGERLLQRALADGDPRQAAEIHLLLSKVTADAEGSGTCWQRHVGEAMRHAGPERADDWALPIYIAAAQAAIERTEHPQARRQLEQVVAATDRVGHRLLHLKGLSNLAMLDGVEGNLNTARGLYERTLRSFMHLNLPVLAQVERTNLFEICAALGLFEEGLRHGDAALAAMDVLSPLQKQASGWNLAVCFAQARRLDKVLQVQDAVASAAATLDAPDLAAMQVVAAQPHVCRDEFDAAGARLRTAIELALRQGRTQHALQWAPLAVHNEIRAGRYSAGRCLAALLLAEPTFRVAPLLDGMRLHAGALELHGRGDPAGARAALNEALTSLPPGRWNVLARLDAAWLDLESGSLAAAQRMLAGTWSWLPSHPLGRYVEARLHQAHGRAGAAVQALEESLVFIRADADFLADLRRCCRSGAAFDGHLAEAPRLPSTL